MPRFHRPGITRFYWVPTIAAATKIPTAAEVTGGVRLDDELFEINGFEFASTFIDTPVMRSKFVPKIAGRQEAADSTLRFYENTGGAAANPIRTALAQDDNGYVVIFPEGPVGAAPAIGDLVDVWPATIGSNSKQYTADNEAASFIVAFGTHSTPVFDAALIA